MGTTQGAGVSDVRTATECYGRSAASFIGSRLEIRLLHRGMASFSVLQSEVEGEGVVRVSGFRWGQECGVEIPRSRSWRGGDQLTTSCATLSSVTISQLFKRASLRQIRSILGFVRSWLCSDAFSTTYSLRLLALYALLSASA